MVLSSKIPEVFHHYLVEDYVIGEYDVFCGRGSQSLNHVGNKHFTSLIQSMLNRYANAHLKQHKIDIITEVIQQVRSLSPNGGFIKQDLENWRYFEIGDALAREKVSQAFRDAIKGITRKQKRKEIATYMSRTIGSTITKGGGSMKNQSSIGFTDGSSTLSRLPTQCPSNLGNKCNKIFQEKDDFSYGHHETVYQTLCDTRKSSLDCKLCDVSNYNFYNIEHNILFDESINELYCEDIIYTNNNAPFDRSIVDIDEDDNFFNFLFEYSKMYQWDVDNFYEPYPFEI